LHLRDDNPKTEKSPKLKFEKHSQGREISPRLTHIPMIAVSEHHINKTFHKEIVKGEIQKNIYKPFNEDI